jgi:hypothetical protein
VTPDPQNSLQVLEQERRRIGKHLDEVGRLAESDSPPPVFFSELIKRLLDALAAPAGVVWMRTAQGHLQLQAQVGSDKLGLDRSEQTKQSHEELLRLAIGQAKPMHLPPSSTFAPAGDGRPAAGNPTELMLLVVPVLQGDNVVGLVEVWQAPNRPVNAVPGFLQYMGVMADLAGRYMRNQRLGQLAGQQQLWTQLEAFARQVHGSLKPLEVAYHVANEGRRLIECDRVSVALRQGGRVTIEAVSGADVVEKRSNLIQLMRKLADQVVRWGEKLVFQGTKDDSLPPPVLHALDAYLAESNSKLLVIQPLHDERDKDTKRLARSALIMECFEPPEEPQQLIARLDVVAKHTGSALYNAIEHRRIPFRFVWAPLAKLQEGLGGKARAIWLLVLWGLAALACVLVLVPYPLKMDASGQLVPVVRRVVYPPEEGMIQEFYVQPGESVAPRRALALVYSKTLYDKIQTLRQEIKQAREAARKAEADVSQVADEKDRAAKQAEARKQRDLYLSKDAALQALQKRTDAVNEPGRDGFFYLRAPDFTDEEESKIGRHEWTVLSPTFQQEWTGRGVKPSDAILRLGAKDGPWELELKIPQKHIGQVLQAYERQGKGKDTLDVDFLLRSDPTRTFKGKLARDRIAAEATPAKEGESDSEPVVLAYVRIDGSDIAGKDRVPREMLQAGIEVRSKVRCGNHRLGYALFYGVWEFFYEKILFWF